MAEITVMIHVDNIWSTYDFDDLTTPMAITIGIPDVFPTALLFTRYH